MTPSKKIFIWCAIPYSLSLKAREPIDTSIKADVEVIR